MKLFDCQNQSFILFFFCLFPVIALQATESPQLSESVFTWIQPESLPCYFFLSRMPTSGALAAAALIEL